MTSNAAADADLRIPRVQLGALVIIGILQSITLIAMVLMLRFIVEQLQKSVAPLDLVLASIGALTVVLMVNAVLRGVEFSFAERVGYQRIQALRMTMYGHLAIILPNQLQNRSRGSLLLRFTGDLTMLRTWISRGFARSIVSGIVLTSGALLLAYLDPFISLAVLAVLFAGAAISLLLGERLRRVTRWVRRRRSLLTSNVDEQLQSLASVQVFDHTAGERSRLSRQNDSMTAVLIREARVRGVLRTVASASAWLAVVAVLAVGSVQIVRGNVSLASVVAAVTCARFMVGPVRNLGLAHDYWQRSKVSRAKVVDFMNSSSSPDAEGADELRVRDGRIAFEGVIVPGALEGLTIETEPNIVVAIVGPSGSGKSTLLRIVAGMTTPASGRVLIDDQDLATVTAHSIRRRIGVVTPELPLMRGSMARNLTYRVPNAPNDEIARVVLQWGLDDVMERHPDGLSTWLTEGGRNLSGGQRQRLALARGFIGNPQILLLDDPTQGLDSDGRELFRRVVTRHSGTILMVTDQPAEIALADRVWVMDHGVVVNVIDGSVYRSGLRAVTLQETTGARS